MPPREPPRLLRIPEAATALSISRTTLYRLINDGEIRTVLVGRHQRVPMAEIDRLIAASLESDQHGDTDG